MVALNLTRRCNLACAHCYLDAGARDRGDSAELTGDEVVGLLGQIAELGGGIMVVLTGGEPLLRHDIETIAKAGSDLGLMMVLGTNGTELDDARVAGLRAAGLAGAGISVDSLDPARHDAFRGRPGGWRKTMAGIDACRRAGLAFQIHFSVTEENAHEFDEMRKFAQDAGALALNIFFLVCTGRGEKYTGISRATHDAVLAKVVEAARDESGLMVRAKCAPHFKRLAYEFDRDWPITTAQGYEAGGCLAGTRYCRITPEGSVTACPYIETPVGSIRSQSFARIWREAPMFAALRAPKLEGRCGACEYRKICGGCRARPMASEGNLMGEDSLCGYQPAGGPVVQPLGPDAESKMTWSREAKARLGRVPLFLRRMVKARAQAYAAGQGRSEVSSDDLRALARRRFGAEGPPSLADWNAAGDPEALARLRRQDPL
ncbi:MAG: radical SAM protein [Alphaproteobacteria bacterium]